MSAEDFGFGVAMTAIVTLVGSAFAGFITHIFWIFNVLMGSPALITGGKVAIMFLGILIPPIGVLHGWYLWFS